MKRRKNRIMCIASAFVFFCGFVFSSPLKVEAAQVQETGQEFYLHYAQPSIGDNQGYVNFLFYSPSRGYYINTIFWNVYCYTENGDSLPVQGEITVKNNGWEFHPYTQLTNYNGTIYSLYMYNADGHCYHLKSSSSDSHVHTTSGTIIGYQAFGNVKINDTYLGNANGKFTVYYATDGSSLLLMEVIDLLMWTYEVDVDIYNTAHSILNSVDGLENQLSSVVNYLKSVDSKLSGIQDELEEIYSKLDEILEEEKKQTSWLEKIWNSIQEFFTPDDKDKETTDKLEESSKEQSNQLNDLNEQNKVDKLDPSTSSGSVDANVDTNAIANYGTVLQIVTNHDYVLRSLLLVVSIGLVAYVLFGKKK